MISTSLGERVRGIGTGLQSCRDQRSRARTGRRAGDHRSEWLDADRPRRAGPADPRLDGDPAAAAAKPKLGPVGIAVGALLLVVGIALMIYGGPAVFTQVEASFGGLAASERHFWRAALAFVGFFLAFVGVGTLTGGIRGRRP